MVATHAKIVVDMPPISRGRGWVHFDNCGIFIVPIATGGVGGETWEYPAFVRPAVRHNNSWYNRPESSYSRVYVPIRSVSFDNE